MCKTWALLLLHYHPMNIFLDMWLKLPIWRCICWCTQLMVLLLPQTTFFCTGISGPGVPERAIYNPFCLSIKSESKSFPDVICSGLSECTIHTCCMKFHGNNCFWHLGQLTLSLCIFFLFEEYVLLNSLFVVLTGFYLCNCNKVGQW